MRVLKIRKADAVGDNMIFRRPTPKEVSANPDGDSHYGGWEEISEYASFGVSAFCKKHGCQPKDVLRYEEGGETFLVSLYKYR